MGSLRDHKKACTCAWSTMWGTARVLSGGKGLFKGLPGCCVERSHGDLGHEACVLVQESELTVKMVGICF
jgi:hypothetical protein